MLEWLGGGFRRGFRYFRFSDLRAVWVEVGVSDLQVSGCGLEVGRGWRVFGSRGGVFLFWALRYLDLLGLVCIWIFG